jgi:hypothetical protein
MSLIKKFINEHRQFYKEREKYEYIVLEGDLRKANAPYACEERALCIQSVTEISK